MSLPSRDTCAGAAVLQAGVRYKHWACGPCLVTLSEDSCGHVRIPLRPCKYVGYTYARRSSADPTEEFWTRRGTSCGFFRSGEIRWRLLWVRPGKAFLFWNSLGPLSESPHQPDTGHSPTESQEARAASRGARSLTRWPGPSERSGSRPGRQFRPRILGAYASSLRGRMAARFYAVPVSERAQACPALGRAGSFR